MPGPRTAVDSSANNPQFGGRCGAHLRRLAHTRPRPHRHNQVTVIEGGVRACHPNAALLARDGRSRDAETRTERDDPKGAVMYAVERQAAIAGLVAELSSVSVNQLAEQYGVTSETIRRDLDALERQSIIRRVHGGAVRIQGSVAAAPVGDSHCRPGRREDVEIALAALSYVPAAHGSLILDAGPATERLAAFLPAGRPIMILTNSVPVAAILAGSQSISLNLLPGLVCPSTRAVVGEQAVAALYGHRVDVAFVEAEGITIDHGLSATHASGAAARRAMIAAARRVVVLAGSSHFGEEATVPFATLQDVDIIITDAGTPSDQIDQVRDVGVDIVVAQLTTQAS
jgi:DeoR family fructose operon transcriptional repressor